jgi:hypothetical protein
LRHICDEALAADTGDELVDAYERGAISMRWNKIAPPQPTLTDTLRVTLIGADDVDSYTIGTVSQAVQNAVARIDKATRRPSSRTDRIT